MAEKGRRSGVEKIVSWAVMVVLIYAFVEMACFWGLSFLRIVRNRTYQPLSFTLSETHKKVIDKLLAGTSYYVHSPSLGWTIKPNGVANLPDQTPGLYRANSQGIRADRDYSRTPAQGVIRIAAFGDSFTHSDDVANQDTWPARLDAMDTNTEVLNFGVGAFSPDQAFLRYQEEGTEFHPHIVLIGFMSENIVRVVSVFRPFLYPWGLLPMTKPRFVINDEGEITLLENPLQSLNDYERLLANPGAVLASLCEDDFHCKSHGKAYAEGFFDFLPSVRLFKVVRSQFSLRWKGENLFDDGIYNTNSEAFRITTRLLQRFYGETLKNGALPIIVLLPDLRGIRRYVETGAMVYRPLQSWLEANQMRTVDVMEGIIKYADDNTRNEFVTELHYSPASNQVVAKTLYDYLRTQDLLGLDRIRAEVEETRSRFSV